jgi:hypothetical protein
MEVLFYLLKSYFSLLDWREPFLPWPEDFFFDTLEIEDPGESSIIREYLK